MDYLRVRALAGHPEDPRKYPENHTETALCPPFAPPVDPLVAFGGHWAGQELETGNGEWERRAAADNGFVLIHQGHEETGRSRRPGGVRRKDGLAGKARGEAEGEVGHPPK